MNVHFYRYDFGTPAAAPEQPSRTLVFRWWTPDQDGPPPQGSRTIANYLWWLMARSGKFRRPGFSELRIEQGERLLHRLIVTPRWYRFPFMAGDDLQIGNVWTSPAVRRQKLARSAVVEAHRRFAGARFWYVTDADNVISGVLARSCGYRLIAVGRRTRRFGLSLFGQYVIDRFIQRADTETHAIAPDCGEESAAGRSLSVSH